MNLVGAGPEDTVIDVAAGTGGFLVAAFDAMRGQAKSPASIQTIREALHGFDTNPTVWALASLNMCFRGDGRGHIALGSSLDLRNRAAVAGRFTRAFLNPPFSQEGEPETDFIDASMAALVPGGILAAVIPAGVFADGAHAGWREGFLRRHTLLAMISLPDELFYPAAAPVTILLAKAHAPQPDGRPVMMARIWNDGFEKRKGRRAECAGSQLPAVREAYETVTEGRPLLSDVAATVSGCCLKAGSEWSPQEYLPQPALSPEEAGRYREVAARSVYRAVARFPELSDEALAGFGQACSALPPMPYGTRAPVKAFFRVANGKSSGERNFADGTVPYISSGDTSNSIIRMIAADPDEVFRDGGITVTAFGSACVQPWPFAARGNGGSAVRVLTPRFRMSASELFWFAAQINMQRWRFFYARMAIKSRLERLVVQAPPARSEEHGMTLARSIGEFSEAIARFSRIG